MLVHLILGVTLVYIAVVIYHINVTDKPESSSEHRD
jgi:uncharacterized membrane protein